MQRGGRFCFPFRTTKADLHDLHSPGVQMLLAIERSTATFPGSLHEKRRVTSRRWPPRNSGAPLAANLGRNCPHGEGTNPQSDLVLASDGWLYCTTYWGSTNNEGTIFRISLDGRDFKTLRNFETLEGKHSSAGFAEGRDGVLYGAAL